MSLFQVRARGFCVAVLLLSTLSAAGAAQTAATVRGRVIDSQSGNGITAAQVSIEGTRLGTTTDATGAFTISGVPEGVRSVVVRRIGYTLQRRQVTVGAAMNELSFSLEAAPSSLE